MTDFTDPAWAVIFQDPAQDRGRVLLSSHVFGHLDVRDVDQAIQWTQQSIRIYGRQIPLPRLTAWYGDPGADYQYSGLLNRAQPWPPLLAAIRDQLLVITGYPFNAVLCNRYDDGSQHQGYHADDEPELGSSPTIASVSFGATRRFLLKSRSGTDRVGLDLGHGSLLLMLPPLQDHFHHALPKTAKPVGLRINLTFRRIMAVTSQEKT